MLDNYYRLLLGNIDINRLKFYCHDHSLDSSKDIMPNTTEKKYNVIYGMYQRSLTKEQWKRFLQILKSNTFKNIINGFFRSFTIPVQFIDFIQYHFGISSTLFDEFSKQKDTEIETVFFDVMDEYESSQYVRLCQITMPELSYELLDPCITALIEAYYGALRNFVILCDPQLSKHFFHLKGTCSPWLEELFELAFIDVNGSSDAQCCRCSLIEGVDDSPVPAKVLKSLQSTSPLNPIVKKESIDPTIHLVDSLDNDIRFGAKKHLYTWRNRVGAFSNISNVFHSDRMIYIDSCYGYSFDMELFEKANALYGKSDAIIFAPDWAITARAFDFLRVPYYLVPQAHASNASELFTMLIEGLCHRCVFRGQTSSYYLNRSEELMNKLYGDKSAKEPSISSYALREKNPFEHHYALWSTIIRRYIISVLGNDAIRFLETIDATNYYMLCLAVAQHYGLPTYGLDISYSISTALFFSFFIYTPSEDRFRNKYIRKESGNSIIYLYRPKPPEIFNYDRFNDNTQLFMRPIAQKASFAHSSWGMATNAIAERMIMAIDFDVKDIDFDELNTLLTQHNFPSLDIKNFFPSDDPFINFLRKEVLLDSNQDKAQIPQSVLDFDNYLKKYIYQIEPVT